MALEMIKYGREINDQATIDNAITVINYQIDNDCIDTKMKAYTRDNSVFKRILFDGLASTVELFEYLVSIDYPDTELTRKLYRYIVSKAETYKNDESLLAISFYSRLYKLQHKVFFLDYKDVAIRLAIAIANKTKEYDGYYGAIENSDQHLSAAEDYMLMLRGMMNVYEASRNHRYKGQVSINVMGASNAAINPDWSKNKFFIRFSEETGINFTFNVYGDASYNEKKALALSTGNNLPDVFIKASLNNYDEVTYGGKTLRSLNELIEGYAPNVKKLLDDNPIVKKSITTADGNIYALPTIYTSLPNNTTTNMRGFFWINQDWMGDLAMPKTPEELKTVLTKFKNEKCTINQRFLSNGHWWYR